MVADRVNRVGELAGVHVPARSVSILFTKMTLSTLSALCVVSIPLIDTIHSTDRVDRVNRLDRIGVVRENACVPSNQPTQTTLLTLSTL